MFLIFSRPHGDYCQKYYCLIKRTINFDEVFVLPRRIINPTNYLAIYDPSS